MTLAEILVAVFIVATVFGTVIDGYIVAAKKAQWSGYSLAAQSLSLHSVEQVRSAV